MVRNVQQKSTNDKNLKFLHLLDAAGNAGETHQNFVRDAEPPPCDSDVRLERPAHPLGEVDLFSENMALSSKVLLCPRSCCSIDLCARYSALFPIVLVYSYSRVLLQMAHS